MVDFLIYDAKVALLIVVFYIFYRLLLSRETFHRVNRIVLLSTAVMSFALPLCVFTMHETVVIDAKPVVEVGDMQIAAEVVSTLWWQVVLSALYIIGVLASLGYTLASVVKVISLIRRSEHHLQEDGIVVCVTDRELSPFSWMHYIVMNRSDYEVNDPAILAHERGHIRLRHSWDLLLVDTLTAFQWFNPAMWMLRQDLRAIHEYEADGAVLSQGFNARQYQYLLITKAASIGGYSIANGISHSTLKNRIHMMLHKKSSGSHLLKLLALIPIIGTALALNAETVTEVVYNEPQKQMVKKGKKAGTIKLGNQTVKVEEMNAEQKEQSQAQMPQSQEAFDVVEEMPQFPGGPSAMIQYLMENVNYPASAAAEGIQGRVIATFVVEKDGGIRDAKVVRSIDPALDAEALRVINAMPKWTPGKQQGKPVAVKYTIPVTFRLQADTNVVETESGDLKGIAGKSASVTQSSGEPFFVVDDNPVSSEVIKKIDPKSIDHIDVLKDQSAVKLYGEQARNGAVLIYTKK